VPKSKPLIPQAQWPAIYDAVREIVDCSYDVGDWRDMGDANAEPLAAVIDRADAAKAKLFDLLGMPAPTPEDPIR
jgi:hypothetical protein